MLGCYSRKAVEHGSTLQGAKSSMARLYKEARYRHRALTTSTASRSACRSISSTAPWK